MEFMDSDFVSGLILGLWLAIVLRYIGDGFRKRYRIVNIKKEGNDDGQLR